MPRDLPVGNSRMLINFDARYRLRDFYYPQVGNENHSGGFPFRFGVWCDGNFAWVHDDPWQRELDFRGDTLVTNVRLAWPREDLTVVCNDTVDFHEDVYLRRVRVVNARNTPRQVRFFFTQDFRIYGNEIGDTALYDPHTRGILHYKDNRYFLVDARTAAGDGFSAFSVGVKDAPGLVGTWKDAEDGELAGNTIVQGAVDSAVAVWLNLAPGGETVFHYWICAGFDLAAVHQLDEMVRAKGPERLVERTASYWNLWVNKEGFNYTGLPEPLVDQFKRSLLIIRTQVDSGGGIVAANDTDITGFARDTYSYVWPRDGALAAAALDQAGYRDLSRQFFDFCLRVVNPAGYFWQKYNPDGSIASSWHPWYRDGREELPIQEDETGLVLLALWQHYQRYRDVEAMKPYYRPLIVQSARFLVDWRDAPTGLPHPSWDLWEERRAIHTFTVAATVAGLRAAGNFAESFGETVEASSFRRAATEIWEAAEKYLYDRVEGRFLRSLYLEADGAIRPDRVVDVSLLGLCRLGVLPPDDPRLQATVLAVREKLSLKTGIGGLARYEGDVYQLAEGCAGKVPGNPWFIAALWLADYTIAKAKDAAELTEALPLLEWCQRHALQSGVMAEQVHPFSGAPLSVSPLTWSHAEYVFAVLAYLDKLAEFSVCPTCGTMALRRDRFRPTPLLTPPEGHLPVGGQPA